MVQGFYSLEEAAQRLRLTPQDLTQMAQRREVRAFADRGTWRFRTQDIEELARQRGMGSDSELQLREAAKAKPEPAAPAGQKGDVLPPVDSSAEVDLGAQMFAGSQGKTSDSDVRLVPESDAIRVESESDVKLESAAGLSGAKTPRPKSAGSDPRTSGKDSDPKLVMDAGKPKRKSGLHGITSGPEESVVPIGSEEDQQRSESAVRLESSQQGMPQSGVQLESGSGHPKKMDSEPTVEINLDEELRKAEGPPSSKLKKVSPFELSSESVEVPKLKAKPKKGTDLKGKEGDSTELLSLGEEKVEVGAGPGDSDVTRASDSGINLGSPSDSGISLAQEDSAAADEDINFDLVVDESTTHLGKAAKPPKASDSSSEFELSLDDSSVPEDEGPGIVKTDFKVPASDSGEIGLASDSSETESSDFELALDDDSLTVEGEAPSEGEEIVLEEGADEVEATAVRPQSVVGELDQVEDLFAGEVEIEEADEERALALAAAQARPVEWGVVPTVFLFPTVLVLLFVGFLLFEMLRGIATYGQPTFLGGQVFDMFDKMLK